VLSLLLRSIARVIARSATRLLDELDALDGDVALKCFRHVVQRQCGHARRGERLHLDAGASRDPDFGRDEDGASAGIRRELEADVIQGKRMAQRDELGRSLRRTDPGEARRDERVALRAAGIQQLSQDVRAHPNGGRRDGATCGHRLVPDVDHPGRALVVEMAQPRHASGPVRMAS
jgi:hypothetical protein